MPLEEVADEGVVQPSPAVRSHGRVTAAEQARMGKTLDCLIQSLLDADSEAE